MDASLPIMQASGSLSEIVNRVTQQGERVRLSKNGKDVAAIISLGDLEALQRLEDKADTDEAERRLADPNDHIMPFEPSH